MTVETELDKFALHMIRQAMKPDVPLADATDAFKAATAYVQMKSKHKPDAPGEGTFFPLILWTKFAVRWVSGY